jgi:copper chaperone CopZ
MRTLFAAAALSFAAPAFACPGSDAAAAHTDAKETVAKAEGSKATLKLSGLDCASCSEKITSALNKLVGVQASAVDYAAGEAYVAFDASKTSTSALVAAIIGLGYSATLAAN